MNNRFLSKVEHISSKKRYKVTEKELIRIIEALREFKNKLLGKILIIYTDHKTLYEKSLIYDIVLRQRLIHEEYGPDI